MSYERYEFTVNYSYGKKTPAHGWTVMRDGEPILALPPDIPKLVVGAITATLQAEADRNA